jgi:hypothetical protein
VLAVLVEPALPIGAVMVAVLSLVPSHLLVVVAVEQECQLDLLQVSLVLLVEVGLATEQVQMELLIKDFLVVVLLQLVAVVAVELALLVSTAQQLQSIQVATEALELQPT